MWWLTIKISTVRKKLSLALLSCILLLPIRQANGQDINEVNIPADSLILIVNDTTGVKQLIDSLHLFVDLEGNKAEREQASQLEDSLAKLNRPFIRDVGIYLDYGKLLLGLISDQEAKNEFGARVIFGNGLFLGAEYGIASITPTNAYRNTNYESEGSYVRGMIGLMQELTVKSKAGIGISYGSGSYSDSGAPILESPSGLFDPEAVTFSRSDITAQWYEIVLVTESRFKGPLYLGFTIRFRVIDNYDTQEPLDVYTLPGYGRTSDNTVPAGNFFIKFSF